MNFVNIKKKKKRKDECSDRCSKSCGPGTKTQTRTIITENDGNGDTCGALTRNASCQINECGCIVM